MFEMILVGRNFFRGSTFCSLTDYILYTGTHPPHGCESTKFLIVSQGNSRGMGSEKLNAT